MHTNVVVSTCYNTGSEYVQDDLNFTKQCSTILLIRYLKRLNVVAQSNK